MNIKIPIIVYNWNNFAWIMEASTNEIPFILYDIQSKTKMNEKKLARRKAYYIKNKEKELARSKAYYIKNKEKELARSKEYRIKNKEKELARHKAYYIKNKEKDLARRKEYAAKNREKINANRAKRYYQKIKPVEDFDTQTPKSSIEVSDAQTSMCPHEIVLSDINKCTICQTREEMLEMGISLMDILEAEKRAYV